MATRADALLAEMTRRRSVRAIPVGYPAPDCAVPDITRKPLTEILDER